MSVLRQKTRPIFETSAAEGEKLISLARVSEAVHWKIPLGRIGGDVNVISNELAVDLAEHGYRFAATSTNYMPPMEHPYGLQIELDIRRLHLIAAFMGATKIEIPMSRYGILNEVFQKAADKISGESPVKVTVAQAPFQMEDHSRVMVGRQTMFSDGVRGLWYVEHLEAQPCA
ncbi:MAG: hypothetical protein WC043_00895 [Pseudobdellovibrionaceae bacterium]